ncbi:MAG: tRNA epoxyqueuosine(34) reductase QueG [Saprospiraceae bacterium]|nr:tRNA epoxyqueuosine(34) reductase QueG [Saprospiraceae bacterium]
MTDSKIFKQKLSQAIKEKATKIGFSACGISKAKILTDEIPRIEKWHNKGYSGDLSYMKRYSDIRPNPDKLLEGSKSIISLTINYYPKQLIPETDNYIIAKYSYGKDYHKVIKKMLNSLALFISEQIPEMKYRCFVDAVPLFEKSWARHSGLGCIGKNTLLITKSGSFNFIGEIITDIVLDYDETFNEDLCGKCTKCIDACPTNALVEPRVLDVNRCISFNTIEAKEDFEIKLNVDFGGRIFGCDICQDVCPWNKNPIPTTIKEFEPSEKLMSLRKKDWENMTEYEFNQLFENSNIKRTTLKGLKRNIKYNQENSIKNPQTDI